jgi:hypothetical protein
LITRTSRKSDQEMCVAVAASLGITDNAGIIAGTRCSSQFFEGFWGAPKGDSGFKIG